VVFSFLQISCDNILQVGHDRLHIHLDSSFTITLPFAAVSEAVKKCSEINKETISISITGLLLYGSPRVPFPLITAPPVCEIHASPVHTVSLSYSKKEAISKLVNQLKFGHGVES
jgi:hypothetical protein